jgi:hypothetical protein
MASAARMSVFLIIPAYPSGDPAISCFLRTIEDVALLEVVGRKFSSEPFLEAANTVFF